eukprot:1174575-Amorphochlora_amoeboformis.AAC.1
MAVSCLSFVRDVTNRDIRGSHSGDSPRKYGAGVTGDSNRTSKLQESLGISQPPMASGEASLDVN